MVIDALEQVAAALEDHGVAATADPPRVNPPAAWLSARRLGRANLAGGHAVIVDVFLIARDSGIPAALESLEDLLGRALDAARAYGLEVTETDLAQSVTLPQGGGPMPAYRLQLEID